MFDKPTDALKTVELEAISPEGLWDGTDGLTEQQLSIWRSRLLADCPVVARGRCVRRAFTRHTS